MGGVSASACACAPTHLRRVAQLELAARVVHHVADAVDVRGALQLRRAPGRVAWSSARARRATESRWRGAGEQLAWSEAREDGWDQEAGWHMAWSTYFIIRNNKYAPE